MATGTLPVSSVSAEDITGITASTGTLVANHSFRIGNAIFLNLKFTGVSASSYVGFTLFNLPSDIIPSSEVSVIAQTNTNTTVGGWLETNGQARAVGYGTLSGVEVKYITHYTI